MDQVGSLSLKVNKLVKKFPPEKKEEKNFPPFMRNNGK